MPDSGRILLRGRDITGMPVHARARLGIARTFQIPQPFGELTVYENALVAARFAGARSGPAAAHSVREALERTGLARKAQLLPAACSFSTASAWNWPARLPPHLACCCSTKSPAA